MKSTNNLLLVTLMGGQFLASSGSLAQEGNQNRLMLEEVTVVAQRREESMQEVPGSISSISGQELVDAGMSDLKSLAQSTPSVYFENQAKSRVVLVMRGIGTAGASSVGSASVGVFVDGVYMPRTSGAIQNLGNVERVEILKGPQGTLYGRNTIGGAMSIYTRKPGQEFAGYVEGVVGNRGSWDVSTLVEGPLIDDVLAASLAVSTSHQGGEREEDFTGIKNDADDNYFRGRLLITPSSELDVDLILGYTDEEADAVLEEPTGEPIFLLSPFVPSAEAEASIARSAKDFYSNETSEPGGVEIETLLASATVNWTSEQFRLSSITAYSSSEFRTVRDFDQTGFDVISTEDESESDSFSQEIRFTSVSGGVLTFDDRLQWLIGGFYLRDEPDQKFRINMGADSLFADVLNGGVPTDSLYHSTVETESYAVFGQASYSITDRLGLTVGLRYSEDTLDYVYRASTDTLGIPAVVVPFTVEDELSFNSTDPRVILDYQFTDSVMAYLSYNQGYQSGGIQFATPDPVAASQAVDKETVKAWETGLKSRWLDERMQFNASLFSYEYEDMARGGIVVIDGVPVSLSANAAGADIKGLEFDLKFLAAEGLILEASYGYLDSEFTEYDFIGTDLSGNALPLAPEHSYRLAAQYDFELADWGAGARADYAWRDEFFYSEDNEAPGGQSDDVGILNASLWLLSPSDQLEFRLFCTNCADEEYTALVTLIGDSGYGAQSTGDRRRYGLSFKYRF